MENKNCTIKGCKEIAEWPSESSDPLSMYDICQKHWEEGCSASWWKAYREAQALQMMVRIRAELVPAPEICTWMAKLGYPQEGSIFYWRRGFSDNLVLGTQAKNVLGVETMQRRMETAECKEEYAAPTVGELLMVFGDFHKLMKCGCPDGTDDVLSKRVFGEPAPRWGAFRHAFTEYGQLPIEALANLWIRSKSIDTNAKKRKADK